MRNFVLGLRSEAADGCLTDAEIRWFLVNAMPLSYRIAVICYHEGTPFWRTIPR